MGGGGGDGGGRGGKFSLDFIRLVALGIVCLLGSWLQRQQEQTEDHKMILADLFVFTATQNGDPLASQGIGLVQGLGKLSQKPKQRVNRY